MKNLNKILTKLETKRKKYRYDTEVIKRNDKMLKRKIELFKYHNNGAVGENEKLKSKK